MKWNPIKCKLGTMPFIIHIDGRSTLKVGKTIRFKTHKWGRYETAIVDSLNPLKLCRF